MNDVPAPFGPLYPKLYGRVQQFRRLANAGPLTREDRRAYGAAVLDAIRSLNRSAGQRALTPASNSGYESGTALTDGRAILAAIRRQNDAALHDHDGNTWTNRRSDKELLADYEAAVACKRVAQLALAD